MAISRRSVLNGIGQSTALAAVMAALSPPLRAAQAAAPAPAAAAPAPGPAPAAAPAATYCLATVYGQAAGASFDADRFRDQHLPMLLKAYGKSANRIELRMPAKGTDGAAPSEIIATVNIWFTDVQEFLKQNRAAAKDITASMDAITKAPSNGQVDQVLATLGEDRLAVPVDGLCLTTYFPNKDGATIDAKYFAETFYPKLAELYGNAVRRVEVTNGAAGAAGGKPTFLNSAHVYIRDEAAFFEEAAVKAAIELSAEAPNHTNIRPMQTLTRLHAAG
jgi:hypothetical protein